MWPRVQFGVSRQRCVAVGAVGAALLQCRTSVRHKQQLLHLSLEVLVVQDARAHDGDSARVDARVATAPQLARPALATVHQQRRLGATHTHGHAVPPSISEVDPTEEGVSVGLWAAVLVRVDEEGRAAQLEAQLLGPRAVVEGQEKGLRAGAGTDRRQQGEVAREAAVWKQLPCGCAELGVPRETERRVGEAGSAARPAHPGRSLDPGGQSGDPHRRQHVHSTALSRGGGLLRPPPYCFFFFCGRLQHCVCACELAG